MAIKYLIQDGTTAYRYSNGWQEITDFSNLNPEFFENFGMSDLSYLNRSAKTFNYNLSSGTILGQGRVFTQALDLKKIIDITSINFT